MDYMDLKELFCGSVILYRIEIDLLFIKVSKAHSILLGFKN